MELRAHCEHRFWLDRADPEDTSPGKVSRGTAIADAYKHSVRGSFANRVQSRLLSPPLVPPVYRRVWSLWLLVSHLRSRNDAGFGPISIGDVATYCDVTGTPMQPWEWEALLMIDGCWLASFHDTRTYPFADPELEQV